MPRRIIPGHVPPAHRWCFQCGTAQPRQCFDTDRKAKDGLAYACRRCLRAKARERAEIKRTLNETYIRLTVPA